MLTGVSSFLHLCRSWDSSEGLERVWVHKTKLHCKSFLNNGFQFCFQSSSQRCCISDWNFSCNIRWDNVMKASHVLQKSWKTSYLVHYVEKSLVDSDSRGRLPKPHGFLGCSMSGRAPCELPAGLLAVAIHGQLLSTCVKTSAEIYHCARALFHPISSCLTCWRAVNRMWCILNQKLAAVPLYSPLVSSKEGQTSNTRVKFVTSNTVPIL